MSQPPACALSRIAAANIARLLMDRGWSQRRLANEAGISLGMASQTEGGRRNLTLPVLERVAAVLGIEAADLLRAAVKDVATRTEGWGVGRAARLRAAVKDAATRTEG